MCICLPSGKFNFKFTRSQSCASKKDGKNKRTLSLISESSEEDEGKDKFSSIQRNGLKVTDYNNLSGDGTNNLGQIRQLSRDRQLPPVPDTIDFGILQMNSPRKNIKNNTNSINYSNDPCQVKQQIEEYGSIYESETYGDSKSPTNKQPNQFCVITGKDPREVDPLYASVLSQINKQKISKSDQKTIAKDYYAVKTSNDHLYSTIVKKDFNSLRKPARPHSSVRDFSYQSLQSLNNPPPGLPLRLYKLSELAYLTNQNTINTCEVKLRKSSHLDSQTSSLRRFSQPNSISNDIEPTSQIIEESQRDVDVLRRIQSQYNTPPLKRASISDVRQLHLDIEESSSHSRSSSGNTADIPNHIVSSRTSDNSDLYRHITVRESLASLRARNALPDNDVLFENPVNVEPNILPHVYEGLYETLYYSSADPHRPPIENEFAALSTRNEIPNPLPYLGQDNYLSITENPLSSNFHTQYTSITHASTRPTQDHSSVIYATTGSEVYAEISDAYLSKQYEELPEQKLNNKDNGQINNGYSSSPGTLRVLLEIQSFRHMDSDVDVSSRSTTPLHPFPRSVIGLNKSSHTAVLDDNNAVSYSTIIRHPWFLPQKSSNTQRSNESNVSSSNSNFKPTINIKPSQNHLAIMTPLMERSMEGSSMFLDDNRNNEHESEDSKVCDDLHMRTKNRGDDDNNKVTKLSSLFPTKEAVAPRLILINEDNDNTQSKRHNKRIVYPNFSGSATVKYNGDKSRRQFL